MKAKSKKARKPKKKSKAKTRKAKKRARSELTGRKAGKQPLAIGEPTRKATIRLPASKADDMEKRAHETANGNVSAYLRKLVEADIARAHAS